MLELKIQYKNGKQGAIRLPVHSNNSDLVTVANLLLASKNKDFAKPVGWNMFFSP